ARSAFVLRSVTPLETAATAAAWKWEGYGTRSSRPAARPPDAWTGTWLIASTPATGLRQARLRLPATSAGQSWLAGHTASSARHAVHEDERPFVVMRAP